MNFGALAEMAFVAAVALIHSFIFWIMLHRSESGATCEPTEGDND